MNKLKFVLIILGIVILNQTSFANDNKIVTGTWKVVVANAPNQYVNSSFIVSEVNGGLTGKVIFDDGQELKVSEILLSGDEIRFVVNIDGSDIKVSGKVENSKITGKVEAPDGILELTAIRKL